MDDGQRDGQHLAELEALLRLPGTAIAAIDTDGFRVPVPASLELPDRSAIGLPPDRATMLDLVLASEGLEVIRTWERATHRGRAELVVHLREEPSASVLLTFLDLVGAHGVMVAVLSAAGSASEAAVPLAAPTAVTAAALPPRSGVLHKTYNAVVTHADDRALRMLGFNREQLVGVRSSDLIHPDDTERAVAVWMSMLSTRQSARVRLRHRRGDGSWLWVEVENDLQSTAGADGGQGDALVITTINDITEEMSAHEGIVRHEHLLRRVVESFPLGLLQVGAGRRLHLANAEALSVLGTPADATLEQHLGGVVPGDRPRVNAALDEALHRTRDAELTVSLRSHSTGELRLVSVTVTALGDVDGEPGALVYLQDITERAQMVAELERRATFDALTGCRNRASVITALDTALAGAPPGAVGVVFIDIDHFKAINDDHGHAAGDQLLVEVTRRLTHLMRQGDVMGRVGGDEFLVVLTDLTGPDQVTAVVRRLAQGLNGTAHLGVVDVELQASLGWSDSQPGDTAEDLIARADTAMYAAKRASRASFASRAASRTPATTCVASPPA